MASTTSLRKASQSDLIGYDEYDAQSRLPFRSIDTFSSGISKAKRRDENDFDLTKMYNINNIDTQFPIRKDLKITKYLLMYITNDLYRIASIFAVIIALFAFDFSRTLVYSKFDDVVEFVLIIIFIFLFFDCLAQSIVYRSYPGSFFFWLDLVGTVTLLADIHLTYIAFGYTQADLTVARGGRAGRAARSATTLKISKMVMWVRVTRLIRLARVLRQFRLMIQNSFNFNKKQKQRRPSTSITSDILNIPSSDDITQQNTRRNSQVSILQMAALQNNKNDEKSDFSSSRSEAVRSEHSSRIGVRVADSITRNVVFGILLTVCLVPIFNYTEEESYSAMYLAMDIFNQQYTDSPSSLSDTIHTFLNGGDGENVYYLNIGGTEYRNYPDIASVLRDTEKIDFNENNVEIKLDISETVRYEHGMAIGFTLLIIFLFAGLAFTISRNISKLVVRPIEKMTKIVQEFTKNICLLGGDLNDQHKIVTELLETDVIEAAITTLGNIFSSLTKRNDNNDDNASKDLNSEQSEHSAPNHREHSFIAPLGKQTAKTLIKSRESIMSIQITQQKRVAIEDEEIMANINKLQHSGDIDSFCIKRGHIPEFASLTTVMQHPVACEYFRLYTVTHMLGESYFFLKAVSEYRESVRNAFLKVYDQHISEKSAQQISILQKDSKKIYDEYKANNIGINIFDNVKREIVASLSAEAFNNFQQSKFAHAYVKSRESNKKRFSHVFGLTPPRLSSHGGLSSLKEQ